MIKKYVESYKGTYDLDGVIYPSRYKDIIKAEVEKGDAEIVYYSEAFKEKNTDIISKINEIDFKSIRALREGNQARLDKLEAQVIELRLHLK